MEITPLIIAYNTLVPLPLHLRTEPMVVAPTAEDRVAPPPSLEVTARKHFRALSGGNQIQPQDTRLSSDEIVAMFPVGTAVRMLYRAIEDPKKSKEDNNKENDVWWAGCITRSAPIKRNDMSYSIRFKDAAYPSIAGPYHYSKNTLIRTDAAAEEEPAVLFEVRKSPRFRQTDVPTTQTE